MKNKIGIVYWQWAKNGNIELTFVNNVTGASATRTYKTAQTAERAEKRFHERMARIYG